MSTPRTKRQFAGVSADPAQRQITSFFSLRSSDGNTPAEAAREPLLPASIQANLLSVGMRVRKSVPEGYKTTGPSGFKLWSDNTPALPTKTSTSMRSSSRELLPFCGINRIGGLESQPNFYLDDEDDIPALDAIPELTMSQESVQSNEPSRKRVYEQDESDQRAPPWSQDTLWDGQISPRSLGPVSFGNARVMAIPRTRVKKPTALQGIGQENMAVDGDFEDAEFLVFGDDPQMDTTG